MIKRITPITYLLVSISILFLSLILLNESKKELVNKNDSFNKYKEVSTNYLNLKENWDNSKNSKKIIDNIIKKVGIKDLVKKVNKKRIFIKFETKSVTKVDRFLSKVLNANLNIIYVNITKNSLELEIGI